MKFVTLILLILFPLFCFSQKQTKLSTIELNNIATNFGIDSALTLFRPFNGLYLIDTTITMSLALKCENLKYNSRQFVYFTDLGQRIRSKLFLDSSLQNIQYFKNVFLRKEVKKNSHFVIPDQLFYVVVFQNNVSLVQPLTNDFNFWEQQADSIKNKYPSGIKRAFQRFKGTPLSEQLFNNCKKNSFKIAWTLNQLGVAEFPLSRVNRIQDELPLNLRDYKMESSKKNIPQRFITDTIELNNSYSSLNEIVFIDEIAFKKYIYHSDPKYCWHRLLTNGNLGLYETGCIYAPRAGQGQTLKLELIDQKRILVTVISGWRS